MSDNDLHDYLDGVVPHSPQQLQEIEETLAHAGMKTEAWKARNETTAVEYMEGRNSWTPNESETRCRQGKNALKSTKGVMVIHINVAAMESTKAEAYIDRVKERLNENGFLDRLKSQGHEIILLPCRHLDNSVEYIKLA